MPKRGTFDEVLRRFRFFEELDPRDLLDCDAIFEMVIGCSYSNGRDARDQMSMALSVEGE